MSEAKKLEENADLRCLYVLLAAPFEKYERSSVGNKLDDFM